MKLDFSYSSEGDGLTTFLAASVQERLIFEKYFFALNFAAINQERLLIESDHYWRGYGNLNIHSNFSPIGVLSPKSLTFANFHGYFFNHRRFLIGKHVLLIP